MNANHSLCWTQTASLHQSRLHTRCTRAGRATVSRLVSLQTSVPIVEIDFLTSSTILMAWEPATLWTSLHMRLLSNGLAQEISSHLETCLQVEFRLFFRHMVRKHNSTELALAAGPVGICIRFFSTFGPPWSNNLSFFCLFLMVLVSRA